MRERLQARLHVHQRHIEQINCSTSDVKFACNMPLRCKQVPVAVLVTW